MSESGDEELDHRERKELGDAVYGDSDDEGDRAYRVPAARGKVTNADLMYDPGKDERDEAWVRRERLKYLPEDMIDSITSDATLACPGCFVTLCFDCQRHETYTGQYRAMFFRNCVVDRLQIVRSAEGDAFHPVRCESCNAEVAMLDEEGIAHFFDVIAR